MNIFDAPIFFEKNRVFRVYTGGKLLGQYVNDGSPDDFFPEEWVASSVMAQPREGGAYKEGVSKIAGEELWLDEAIEKYPKEILGDKKELGVLVKFLDSAIRLPIQAHPDKPFSRQYFNSDHGKEESWLVLAKRPGGCVYFGFKEGVTREEFSEAIEKSMDDKEIMEKFLVRHDIEPGDFIFVPAKTVHAIGAGCLILEVQEPTDFTIQPEYWCGDYKLSHQEMYIGLDKELALDCFTFEPTKDVKLPAKLVEESAERKIECLVDKDLSENFSLNRIILKGGEFKPEISAGIYVITEGEGEVVGDGYSHSLKVGDYFLMPHAAKGKYTIKGNMTVMECFA